LRLDDLANRFKRELTILYNTTGPLSPVLRTEYMNAIHSARNRFVEACDVLAGVLRRLEKPAQHGSASGSGSR
jgi:hypothetical protein